MVFVFFFPSVDKKRETHPEGRQSGTEFCSCWSALTASLIYHLLQFAAASVEVQEVSGRIYLKMLDNPCCAH